MWNNRKGWIGVAIKMIQVIGKISIVLIIIIFAAMGYFTLFRLFGQNVWYYEKFFIIVHKKDAEGLNSFLGIFFGKDLIKPELQHDASV